MRILFLALLPLILIACNDDGPKVTYYEYHSNCPMMTIIDSSMVINKLKCNGDPDIDLAVMTKIYLTGAITAEQYEIERGKDYLLQQIAKTMRTRDSGYILSVDAFLAVHVSKTANSDIYSEVEHAADKMQHSADLQLIKDNEDHDFAILMVPHNQCGIDIAEVILHNSKDNALVNIAMNIKKEKNNDIERLQRWLLESQNLK